MITQNQHQQQPIYHPMIQPVDAAGNDLIRMLQAQPRIGEKESENVSANANNKDVKKVCVVNYVYLV